MKKLILISVFVAGVLETATAQKIVIKTYMELTVSSPKTGTAVGFENKYGWEYGAFFQNAMSMSDSERARPRTYEKDYSGVYFAAPVIQRRKFTAKINIRTGLVNGENFAITPSFTGQYSPLKFLQLGGGVGVRTFSPFMQGFVSFRF